MSEALPVVIDDGGRADAGFKGEAGDCGVRAVAIALRLDYRYVYDAVNLLARDERPRGRKKRSSAREGIHTALMHRLMAVWGWEWTPTMFIGSGTTVHLAVGELPDGPLIVRCSKHYVAVVDGVVRDTHDPTRGGQRAVYGWWAPFLDHADAAEHADSCADVRG